MQSVDSLNIIILGQIGHDVLLSVCQEFLVSGKLLADVPVHMQLDVNAWVPIVQSSTTCSLFASENM